MPAECSVLTMVLNSLTPPGGAVARLGREEADRVVAPVVAQPLLDQVAVVDEGVHRHQLDRGDAEPPQVVDHRRGGEAGIGAAQPRRHVGMAHGEAVHVQLVDHRLVPGHARRPVVAPGEGRVDDAALRHARRIVAAVERQVLVPVADAVAEMRVAPAQVARRVLGVGIDQQLVRVEAVAVLRARTDRARGSRRAARAAPRADSSARSGRSARCNVDALQLAPAARVEQAQLDLARRVPRTARS